MTQASQQVNLGKLRILVAPLDWGLGHATRCIPIIQELIRQNCEVTLAGEGAQEILLKKEFPSLAFLSLPGYRIRYAGTSRNMLWKMIKQIPGIQNAIEFENNWLKKKVKELGFDAIISDNRYGLYHKKVPCVFISHQLLIKSPWKWTEKILQMQHYRFINRFTECWVPDLEGTINLAGDLSHPHKKPKPPLQYIGHLSRFINTGTAEKKNHLLIILSGPEPQRSIFENIIINQVSRYNGSATILRGLPASVSFIPSTDSIHFYNHLPAEELNQEMEKAAFVIARSGYSTVMDAKALKKKCIFIPTQGQTEQEYLAGNLFKKQFSFSALQRKFSLDSALEEAGKFSYLFPEIDMENRLQKNITRFLSTCQVNFQGKYE